MKSLNSLTDVAEYFRGISKRINHHASHWRPIVQTLAFELQAGLAPNVPLQARTYNGNLANQIKLTLRNGREIKITYHSSRQEISIADAKTQKAIHVFSPTDKIESVARRCRQLARQRTRVRLRLVA
jgi:hypothetical protein